MRVTSGSFKWDNNPSTPLEVRWEGRRNIFRDKVYSHGKEPLPALAKRRTGSYFAAVPTNPSFKL